jgi:hypothetical protein
MMGLMPILWSLGTGADMMKRIAAPMIGGLVTSFILELLVYPPVYAIGKWHFEVKRGSAGASNQVQALHRTCNSGLPLKREMFVVRDRRRVLPIPGRLFLDLLARGVASDDL